MQSTSTEVTAAEVTARTAANRKNAERSTGPRTDAGKARSSRNAVRGALTGRVVVLPNDDLDAYQTHVLGYKQQFKPCTDYELGLVQALADTDWRLQRIPHLIMALMTKGREEFAEAFHHLKPAERAVRIELETTLKYEKQLRNLQLQENRLHRRHEKDVAELRSVQRERETRYREDLTIAAKVYVAAQHEGLPFDAQEHGFDFSTHEVEVFLQGQRAAQLDRDLRFGPPQANPDLAA